MLNINLKIEAKNSWVIDNVLEIGDDLPRSKELKMFYDIFEDCFLKQFLKMKESKRIKKNFYFKSSMTKKQNKLRLKFFKLSDSLIYLESKIEYLKKPFPNQDATSNIKLLESQMERIREIIISVKEELNNSYFGIIN